MVLFISLTPCMQPDQAFSVRGWAENHESVDHAGRTMAGKPDWTQTGQFGQGSGSWPPHTVICKTNEVSGEWVSTWAEMVRWWEEWKGLVQGRRELLDLRRQRVDGAISKQQSEYWQQEVVLVMCISVQFPEERDIWKILFSHSHD